MAAWTADKMDRTMEYKLVLMKVDLVDLMTASK